MRGIKKKSANTLDIEAKEEQVSSHHARDTLKARGMRVVNSNYRTEKARIEHFEFVTSITRKHEFAIIQLDEREKKRNSHAVWRK